jgi:DNA topoisomerase-1
MATQREKLNPVPEKDPPAAAAAAGLQYVQDDGPGITRRRRGKGFQYLRPDGTSLTDEAELGRIKALAIPPAWSDVWIAPDPQAHIQATGRDARGRKQYRYHAEWQAARDSSKYGRMLQFGAALPRIRARVERDLTRPGLPREKVLATVVRLLETTLIRVGNSEYARQNKTYGLTTLRNRHAAVRGSQVRFQFKGKSGVRHSIDIADRRLAQVIKECRDLPGELFSYVDDEGVTRDVTSEDVNAYLREITGEDWTAKDFRTWAATVLCAEQLGAEPPGDTRKARSAAISRAVRAVAEQLGNTPAVCRKAYIHPAVLEHYLDGSLPERLQRSAEDQPSGKKLRDQERAIINLLCSLEA